VSLRSLLVLLVVLAPSVALSSLPYSKTSAISHSVKQWMAIENIPAVAIAYVRDGKLEWSHAYGYSDLENGIYADTNTLFRIGSLAKPLSATLALQLAEKDQLDLDKPVWDYCDSFPQKPDVVTSRQVLSHTAGIRSYNMPWKEFERELFSTVRYQSVSDALKIFSDDDLLFRPGTNRKYSTYGYSLLGCVIEGANNKTYIETLQNLILSKLQMQRTFPDSGESIRVNRARYYRQGRKGSLQLERYVDMSNKLPGGGLVSSVDDMAKFITGYFANQLISIESREMAYQPTLLSNGKIEHYGLGWEIRDRANSDTSNKEIFHSGVTPGATSILYTFPDKGDAIIVLTNKSNVETRLDIVDQINTILNN